MRWTYVLCAMLVMGSLIPMAGATDALCTPVADATAKPIADRYYKLQGAELDVWRETNGIPGLQLDSEMACGAAADFHHVDAGASSL